MLKIKRGDTFAFYADIKNDDGLPLVLDVTSLNSQVRDTSYQLISNLDVSTTEKEGRYLFKAGSTEEWPSYTWGENTLLIDIEIREGDVVSSSDTVRIKVIKDVTDNV